MNSTIRRMRRSTWSSSDRLLPLLHARRYRDHIRERIPAEKARLRGIAEMRRLRRRGRSCREIAETLQKPKQATVNYSTLRQLLAQGASQTMPSRASRPT